MNKQGILRTALVVLVACLAALVATATAGAQSSTVADCPDGAPGFSSTGSHSCKVPAGKTSVDVLLVGGGGGGGGAQTNLFAGGGGGAGEVKVCAGISVSAGTTLSLSVGAGGTGGTSASVNGSGGQDSYLGKDCFSNGGAPGQGGEAFGTGGLGGASGSGQAGGNGITGNARPRVYYTCAGGGGGGSAPTENGGDATGGGGGEGGEGGSGGGSGTTCGTNYNGGTGGGGQMVNALPAPGLFSNLSTTYGGGGGGGVVTGTGGTGANGGGGGGDGETALGAAGAPNTGGGGGGGGGGDGGPGGSGYVQLRFSGGGRPPTEVKLTVTKSGTGSGTVSGSGIDCGDTCSADEQKDSKVTLKATATEGSEFTGWSGACSGASTTCTLTMHQAHTVNATFVKLINPVLLKVTKSGTGSGKVDDYGIDCGTECEVEVEQGSKVTLKATPDAGSTFAGWSGGCSGTKTTCTLTMSQAQTVDAKFSKGASNSFIFVAPPAQDATNVRSRVVVPGAGRIRQSATRTVGGRRVNACRTDSRRVSRAGRFTLSCALTAATRAARRSGPVRVRVCATYTPTGGAPNRKCRTVILSATRPNFTG